MPVLIYSELIISANLLLVTKGLVIFVVLARCKRCFEIIQWVYDSALDVDCYLFALLMQESKYTDRSKSYAEKSRVSRHSS